MKVMWGFQLWKLENLYLAFSYSIAFRLFSHLKNLSLFIDTNCFGKNYLKNSILFLLSKGDY